MRRLAAFLLTVACSAPAAPPAPVDAASVGAALAALPTHRHPDAPGHAAARAHLVATLRAHGYAPRLDPFETPRRPDADLANVEVRLPATGARPGLLVLGAHYDTVAGTPGADDNGSGVVTLLELARRLAGESFHHEVRLVWFDLEEEWLTGSGHYVADLPEEDGARFLGMIGLETMGYTDRRPGSQRLPPGARLLHDPGDVGDFLMVVGNLASAPLAQRVSANLATQAGGDFRVETFSLIPGAGWLLPDIRRSDHARFWDAGLPALMLTDTANFRNPHYHRAGDRAETLDLPFLAAAVRGLEAAVRDLADDSAVLVERGGER